MKITDPTKFSTLRWYNNPHIFNNGIQDQTCTVVNTFLGVDNSSLPIQLSSFSATVITDKGVTLTWETISEVNNYGFYVQRDDLDIGFIAGHGTTLQPQTYTFTDKSPVPGQHKYRLKQVDLDGTTTSSESVIVNVNAPLEYSLSQNHPNPFNPTTTIHYGLSQKSNVQLKVYNTLGQEVATLVQEEQEVGYHEVLFDGSGLASGVYLYRIQAGSFVQTRKLLLLK